ncbi:PTS sugar transporter subunit IIB [Carnobacterium maltaromaticum]|uniref:PTS system mannose/fructose/N-acetylgalactosamine-transporter subunit IIB n=1 Tax=Carnobacterium maltaromaticum TaxID=2751 RepID=UPI00295EF561|nr:PTS sugar transporter subunit IIB [Carnobacterium maltaromaticum]
MVVSFIRIDDRIIHGQVVTRWMSERKCDGVIAVDDYSATNPILAKVLKSAVPHPLKAFVLTVENAGLKWKDIISSQKNYFLIVRTPETLLELLKVGADFIQESKQLNVGPMSAREGATRIGPNVCITKEEADAFDQLKGFGMEISFKLVPDSKGYVWQDAKKELL